MDLTDEDGDYRLDISKKEYTDLRVNIQKRQKY